MAQFFALCIFFLNKQEHLDLGRNTMCRYSQNLYNDQYKWSLKIKINKSSLHIPLTKRFLAFSGQFQWLEGKGWLQDKGSIFTQGL